MPPLTLPADLAAALDAATPAPEADGYAPRIEVRVEDGIGWMVFDNPRRRNAVTLGMWKQIPVVCAALDAAPEVRVVALRGEGEASFVSGADISEFDRVRSTPEDVAAYDVAGKVAGAAILGLKKPTVAVIRTWCIGGGMATALNCDLRFAAENTRFAVPAARLGLGYRYAGIRTLVDIVGAAAAREIFFTARQYDAAEALRMGLISRTAPVEGFEAAARDYLLQIAGNAPLTVAAAKMAINVALEDHAERDLAEVEAAVAACFASEDYEEGRRAFREKRKPEFKGR
ncbi:MAG: enoyl-CoA hydratase [Pseudomonadota bacterium]|nr:enoyl-CoA hydratase [Pseudomonadota bacterium]MEE3099176.1 enoyl-CoA hydratase [Pseudomonadota bacterium]